MRKSIKRSILKRIVATICATVMCCIVVNVGMVQIKKADLENQASMALLQEIQLVEIAHYKW